MDIYGRESQTNREVGDEAYIWRVSEEEDEYK